MPHLKPSSKDDATIILALDPSFTGVLRGVAHDVSEGCAVMGNCIVKVNKTIKVRRLIVWLEGRCKVNLKGSGYSVATTDAVESRTVYSKDLHFLGDDGRTHILTPGQYIYPFSFDLPASVPASFRGKRGYVRYRLQASIYRPMFASDIYASRDIPIKRCLLNEQTPIAELRETYEGRHHTNKLYYTAAAPTISYREGGLIRLNLTMQLTRPETQSIRTVTTALRERVQYRTTDSNANTVLSKTDNLFPLGYSTFYPNQSPDYDPKEKADYNALFRLCPRVNADMNSRLLKVTHALVINIMVEDTCTDEDDSEVNYETEATESEWASASEDDRGHTSDVKTPFSSPSTTPPPSTPGSPDFDPQSRPAMSRSSSTSSLVSIFTLGRSHNNNIATTTTNNNNNANTIPTDDITMNGMNIPTIKPSRRHSKLYKFKDYHHHHHGNKDPNEPKLTLCTLEVPLVVTSREHILNEKTVAAPPSYEQVEEPPSYKSTLKELPRAPNYDDSTTATASSSTSSASLSSSLHQPLTPPSEPEDGYSSASNYSDALSTIERVPSMA
ncbi:hypothetical protein BDF20DRAFT_862954 [Mycotypha africana]|uniref:uncharacterized protein n=1 Tax=Mycotypha africana TaxID=64632 RepID=UPI002301830A|nr:uncharacterized protein BDF20DRAFT_862954 [Mycotypha africana]KAI8981743.1 hypothetical protein BDF20DRAFT_862954 [Mycotypha africana]